MLLRGDRQVNAQQSPRGVLNDVIKIFCAAHRIGNIPPAEAEANFYVALKRSDMAV